METKIRSFILIQNHRGQCVGFRNGLEVKACKLDTVEDKVESLDHMIENQIGHIRTKMDKAEQPRGEI